MRQADASYNFRSPFIGRVLTTKVLLQVIMEFDAPKLDILPRQLLCEMIRINDRLARECLGQYFASTFNSFHELRERSEAIQRKSPDDDTPSPRRLAVPGRSAAVAGSLVRE